MKQITIDNHAQQILNGSLATAFMLAFAVPGYAAELPASVAGKASDALVTLATTGNPEPLHAELGGTVISSEPSASR